MTTAPDYSKDPKLDAELGTIFDWVDWPPGLFDDGEGRIIQQSERLFVSNVTDMLKIDGTAQSLETALTMPLRQANKTISKPSKDKGQTEFVKEVLLCSYEDGGMETSLEMLISQMTWACSVRKTYHEKIWTRRKDGKIGYKDIAWRPPSSCELIRERKTGRKLGFRQFQDWQTANPDPKGFVTIDQQNALIYVHGTHRNPMHGTSDLDVMHWVYQLKQKLLFMWSTFLGNQSLPKVVAYGKDPTEAKKNATMLAGLRSSGVLGMVKNNPEDKLFELLETAGQGAAQFQLLCNYLDGQASRSVMAGWMDLAGAASSGTGSYALSSDQSSIFLESRYAVAKEIAETFTQQVIAPLVWLNFGSDAMVPKLLIDKISTDQAAKAMGMLQTLGSAPNMNVPEGFIDLLMERVAQYLDLDEDKVSALIEQRQTDAQQQRMAAEQQGTAPPLGDSGVGQVSDKVQAILNTVLPGGNVGVATPPMSGAPNGTLGQQPPL